MRAEYPAHHLRKRSRKEKEMEQKKDSGVAVSALVQMACAGGEKPVTAIFGHGSLNGTFFAVDMLLFSLSGVWPAGGEETVRRVYCGRPRRYAVEIRL